MMKEIGSDFWLEKNNLKESNSQNKKYFDIGCDTKLLLSGRTAIDYVLKDILNKRSVGKVYFPSYCCKSMIQPFIDNGIKIVFYNVSYEEGLNFEIDVSLDCDLFFAMNYFGFNKGRMDEYIDAFKKRNVTVIEDITHSLLSDRAYNNNSDYIIASLRKWFPIISGGLAAKQNGKFSIEVSENTLTEMITMRTSAMIKKARYMNQNSNIKKTQFLKDYSDANAMLRDNYVLHKIDELSLEILQNLDIESIINRRKRNAEILYKVFSNDDRVNFLFPEIAANDCPIFIPMIFVSKTERDKMREHLIGNDIFCPIHWPMENGNLELNEFNFSNHELSLVVDQRYDANDMRKIGRRFMELYE